MCRPLIKLAIVGTFIKCSTLGGSKVLRFWARLKLINSVSLLDNKICISLIEFRSQRTQWMRITYRTKQEQSTIKYLLVYQMTRFFSWWQWLVSVVWLHLIINCYIELKCRAQIYLHVTNLMSNWFTTTTVRCMTST